MIEWLVQIANENGTMAAAVVSFGESPGVGHRIRLFEGGELYTVLSVSVAPPWSKHLPKFFVHEVLL